MSRVQKVYPVPLFKIKQRRKLDFRSLRSFSIQLIRVSPVGGIGNWSMFLKRHFPWETQGKNIHCSPLKQSDLFSCSYTTDVAHRAINKCLSISNKWVMGWAGIHDKLCDLASRLLHLSEVVSLRDAMNLTSLQGLVGYQSSNAISHIHRYHVTNCMMRVRASSIQRDILLGHCFSNVTYLSMFLSCPYFQAAHLTQSLRVFIKSACLWNPFLP